MAHSTKPDEFVTLHGFDVIIVGAGIAGALVAKTLGLAGKKVLILEAGEEIKPNNNDYMTRFYQAASKVPESPYTPEILVSSGEPSSTLPFTQGQRSDITLADPKDLNIGRPSVLSISVRAWQDPNKGKWDWTGGGKEKCDYKNVQFNYFVQQGPLPFASTYERIAGGTARHWLGISLRHLPNDFAMKQKYVEFAKSDTENRPWPDWPKGCGYEDLLPWYDRAEQEIGVSGDAAVQRDFEQPFGGKSTFGYPMPAIPLSHGDKFLNTKLHERGITAEFKGGNKVPLKVTPIPAARNSEPFDRRRACAGNTNCIPICPIQAKYDPTITLRDALNTGNVKILYRAVACNIAIADKEMKSKNAVEGIDFIHYDRDEKGSNVRGHAIGKLYVLAANAIETPRLMLMSNDHRGISGRKPCDGGRPVGCYLMDHPFLVAGAMTAKDEQVFPYRGPLVTGGIEVLRDGGFRKNHASLRVDVSNTGWNLLSHGRVQTLVEDLILGRNDTGLNESKNPIAGAALIDAINRVVTRQVGLGFLIEQTPDRENCVGLSAHTDGLKLPRPEIHYDFSKYTKDGLGEARKLASKIFCELGWQEVTDAPKLRPPCVEGPLDDQQSENPGAPTDACSFVWTDPDTKKKMTIHYMGAGHIAGTCRMGHHHDDDSVVSSDLQSWDHHNLYIVGSSVFPTLGTANPTLTIAALSLRLGDHLVKQLPPRM